MNNLFSHTNPRSYLLHPVRYHHREYRSSVTDALSSPARTIVVSNVASAERHAYLEG